MGVGGARRSTQLSFQLVSLLSLRERRLGGENEHVDDVVRRQGRAFDVGEGAELGGKSGCLMRKKNEREHVIDEVSFRT